MSYLSKNKKLNGWKHKSWRSCKDITVADGRIIEKKELKKGTVVTLSESPHYFRCRRCWRLVTWGMISNGGCACGYRELNSATELTLAEIILLKLGWYMLRNFEIEDIRPFFPNLAVRLRHSLLRV